MKKIKMLIAAVLSFSTALIGVGYAQLTSTIGIEASIVGTMQDGVFISDVTTEQIDGVTVNTYFSTVLNSEVTLNGAGDKKTLKIEFYNNSTGNFSFEKVEHAGEAITDAYSNMNIEYSCTLADGKELARGTRIAAGQSMTVEMTFAFKDGYTPTSDKETLKSILKFSWVDEDELVNETVSKKFEDILNDTEEDESKNKYNQLTQAMTEKYDGSREWTATYIGNVAGSDDKDSQLLKDLFGELSLDINGNNVNVTCIIKHEDVDGNTDTGDSYEITVGTGTKTYKGCEMTLYLTTEDLSKKSFGDSVPVYAMVFTKKSASDKWEQIGEELYEGTAQVVGYVGGTSSGSFDTGTWRSSKEYNGISSGATIQTLIKVNNNSTT